VKGGGKFVFVADGKVYTLANQNLAALTEHAGETVSLTGDVNGSTVTVSKVTASGK
jgi:DNA-binding IclR family transcriptional regulator